MLFNGCYNSELCFNAVDVLDVVRVAHGYWTRAQARSTCASTNKNKWAHFCVIDTNCLKINTKHIYTHTHTLKKTNRGPERKEKRKRERMRKKNTHIARATHNNSNWQCVKQSVIRSQWCGIWNRNMVKIWRKEITYCLYNVK